MNIPLTQMQIHCLDSLLKKAVQAHEAGKPGMILAQVVHDIHDGGYMRVGFIDHDKALGVQAVVDPGSVGKVLAYDCPIEEDSDGW